MTCLARGCKKTVPDAALKEGDGFCSTECFRSTHGVVTPASGMYKFTRPTGDQMTKIQVARQEVDRQARIAVAAEVPPAFAHLMDDA